MTNEIFITHLLSRVPELEPIHEAHVIDNDGLLPHVFLGDVARYVINATSSGRCTDGVIRVLETMEYGLAEDGNVENLITVSFVENLVGEDNTLRAIGLVVGPRMRRAIELSCH